MVNGLVWIDFGFVSYSNNKFGLVRMYLDMGFS